MQDQDETETPLNSDYLNLLHSTSHSVIWLSTRIAQLSLLLGIKTEVRGSYYWERTKLSRIWEYIYSLHRPVTKEYSNNLILAVLNVTFSLYSSTEVNLKNEEGSFQLISKDSKISYKFEDYRPQVLRDLYLNSYVERKFISYKHNFIIKYPKCHTQGIHCQCWNREKK